MRYTCPDQPNAQDYRPFTSMVSATVLAMTISGQVLAATPNNPCAGKCAPRSINPCAAQSPCAAKMNPCAIQSVKRPANYQPYQGSQAGLKAYGAKLYKDTKLSSNSLSCETCHQGNNLFQPSFAKTYPHEVAMAKTQFGMSQVVLDEMVQICMVAPMASKALGWESRELAALTAYVASLQTSFKQSPDAAKNPCAAKK